MNSLLSARLALSLGTPRQTGMAGPDRPGGAGAKAAAVGTVSNERYG